MANRLVSVDESNLFPPTVMEALDGRYGAYMPAGSNGVVGDGTTDDSTALNSLLTVAAAAGLPVRLDPKSTVLVAANPIMVPTGTRLYLNGARIKSALPNTGSRLVIVQNATNVIIDGEGGSIDGNKAAFTPATEQRHNVHIVGATNVTVRDLLTFNAKGDGIYVGDQTNGAARDVYLENVVSDQNWRQGLSISHVSGFTATHCDFTNTAGTDPQAGVDIEPNVGNVVCENIRFFGCTMKGNAHFGFLVAIQTNPTVKQGDILLCGCDIVGNGAAGDGAGGGIRLIGVTDFTMLGGSVRGNTGPGVVMNGTAAMANVNLDDVAIELNTQHGISVAVAVAALSIVSCAIRSNSQQGSGLYDGINMTPSAAMASPKVQGNSVTGSHRYAITTGANVSGLQLIGNDYSGFVTGATNLLDSISTRVEVDSNSISFGPRAFFYGASGSTSPVVSVRQDGDSSDRVNILADGRVTLGSGAASSDVVLQRSSAGVWGMTTGNAFRVPSFTTATRPAASSIPAGGSIYDSTLGKPIWSTGSQWRDAAGTVV